MDARYANLFIHSIKSAFSTKLETDTAISKIRPRLLAGRLKTRRQSSDRPVAVRSEALCFSTGTAVNAVRRFADVQLSKDDEESHDVLSEFRVEVGLTMAKRDARVQPCEVT